MTETAAHPHDGRASAARGATAPEPAYRAYHDDEWGVPIRDERHLFELLILEGAQAGLSWSTILRKREGYRRAFAGFDAAAVAAFGDADVAAAARPTPGSCATAARSPSAIGNARATLELQAAGSSLVDHLWSFVGRAADRQRLDGRWARPRPRPTRHGR